MVFTKAQLDLISNALNIAEAATDWDNLDRTKYVHPDMQSMAMQELLAQVESMRDTFNYGTDKDS